MATSATSSNPSKAGAVPRTRNYSWKQLAAKLESRPDLKRTLAVPADRNITVFADSVRASLRKLGLAVTVSKRADRRAIVVRRKQEVA